MSQKGYIFCNEHMGHMSSSRQFAIMSLHAGQKNYHEVCTNYLSHSAISSIDSEKGSIVSIYSHDIVFASLKNEHNQTYYNCNSPGS